MKYIIALFMVISIAEVFFNIELQLPLNSTLSVKNILFLGLIQLILFSSIILFISSLFIREKDVIELECPSLFKSRRGAPS